MGERSVRNAEVAGSNPVVSIFYWIRVSADGFEMPGIYTFFCGLMSPAMPGIYTFFCGLKALVMPGIYAFYVA